MQESTKQFQGSRMNYRLPSKDNDQVMTLSSVDGSKEMQVSTRGHFSSKIQKIPFITFLNAPFPLPPQKKSVCDPDQMKCYMTNIMSFSPGKGTQLFC